MKKEEKTALYHLPGLFEFYDFYKVFLPVWRQHREWFYSWCDIASIYGAPADCLWGGGRAGFGDADVHDLLSLLEEYNISARLTFSNSLLVARHLSDKKCNELCRLFSRGAETDSNGAFYPHNGIILHSDLLASYIKEKYPSFYLVSSTTKVLTSFEDFKAELDRDDFSFVVPDFRLNRDFDHLAGLSQKEKDKVEFLSNECCNFYCKERKTCYENVSRMNLGEDVIAHKCSSPLGQNGYKFSLAMKNPAFIGIEDIQEKYLPLGFSNFKIEGRGLGSAILLEFILYYMTKREYQLELREEIYLDSMLDLF